VQDQQYTPKSIELKDGARIEIRCANREDVKAIHLYFLELGVVARGLRFGGDARPKNRGYVRNVVERHDMLIAVDTQGNVIGDALYDADPFDHPAFRDWANIEVAVAAQWRWRGVGTALVEALSELARSAGIRRFLVETHHRNWQVQRWAGSRGAEQFDDPEPSWHQYAIDI
jgi:GNAT superfamily N-acetyltransferase